MLDSGQLHAGVSGTVSSFVVDFPGVQLEHRQRGFQQYSEIPQCHREKQAGDTCTPARKGPRHKDPTAD